MGEDIKILEELIKEGFSAMCPSEAKAIENLIKGYRELEEKVKELNFYILAGANTENWISKSKIKEKIEEYRKMIEKRPYDKPIIEIYIRVLQKLMEDK